MYNVYLERHNVILLLFSFQHNSILSHEKSEIAKDYFYTYIYILYIHVLMMS